MDSLKKKFENFKEKNIDEIQNPFASKAKTKTKIKRDQSPVDSPNNKDDEGYEFESDEK